MILILNRRKARLAIVGMLAGAMLLHLASPIIFQASVSYVRQAQQALLRSAEGQKEEEIIYVSSASFETHFDDKQSELEIAGMRYDVDSYQRNGKVVVCKVIRDDKEEQLISSMKHRSIENRITNNKFSVWQLADCPTTPIFYVSKQPLPYHKFQAPADESLNGNIAESYVAPPPDEGACEPSQPFRKQQLQS